MSRNVSTILAAAVAALVLATVAGPASAGVNVNLNIGPPAVVVSEPPEVVAIPQSMVYFAPGVSVELLFCNGYWWTPREGRWYRSHGYNGPWVSVGPRGVPAEIVRLPRDYRAVYVRGEHVPYGQLKNHWHRRDLERREHRGEWKHMKEERKEARRDFKEHKKAERRHEKAERGHDRDDRGNGGGHGRGR